MQLAPLQQFQLASIARTSYQLRMLKSQSAAQQLLQFLLFQLLVYLASSYSSFYPIPLGSGYTAYHIDSRLIRPCLLHTNVRRGVFWLLAATG